MINHMQEHLAIKAEKQRQHQIYKNILDQQIKFKNAQLRNQSQREQAQYVTRQQNLNNQNADHNLQRGYNKQYYNREYRHKTLGNDVDQHLRSQDYLYNSEGIIDNLRQLKSKRNQFNIIKPLILQSQGMRNNSYLRSDYKQKNFSSNTKTQNLKFKSITPKKSKLQSLDIEYMSQRSIIRGIKQRLKQIQPRLYRNQNSLNQQQHVQSTLPKGKMFSQLRKRSKLKQRRNKLKINVDDSTIQGKCQNLSQNKHKNAPKQQLTNDNEGKILNDGVKEQKIDHPSKVLDILKKINEKTKKLTNQFTGCQYLCKKWKQKYTNESHKNEESNGVNFSSLNKEISYQLSNSNKDSQNLVKHSRKDQSIGQYKTNQSNSVNRDTKAIRQEIVYMLSKEIQIKQKQNKELLVCVKQLGQALKGYKQQKSLLPSKNQYFTLDQQIQQQIYSSGVFNHPANFLVIQQIIDKNPSQTQSPKKQHYLTEQFVIGQKNKNIRGNEIKRTIDKPDISKKSLNKQILSSRNIL